MIRFVVPRAEEFGIGDYLASWGRGVKDRIDILHYEDLPGRRAVPPGTWIFSSLDQLTPGALRLVCELQDQLRAAGMPVLNDPRRVLLRYELLRELQGQGINRHGVSRAHEDATRLRFPVFLRECHHHSGALSPLLHTPADVDQALGRAALKGHRLEDLLLVEYFETADREGRYRKYSAYVVGPAVFPRGLGMGADWMLKAESNQFTEAMLREEHAYATEDPYAAQLRRIFEVSGAEFGRMDFAVKDGRVEAWEINLNPTIGPGRAMQWPDWVVAMRQPTRDLFDRRFREALEAIDTVVSTEPVPVRYSDGCLWEAVPMVRPRPAEAMLVKLFRAAAPLRPVFNRLVRVVAPLVARLTRGRSR